MNATHVHTCALPPKWKWVSTGGANNINLHLALDLMHYKHPTVHLKRPKKNKINRYNIQ